MGDKKIAAPTKACFAEIKLTVRTHPSSVSSSQSSMELGGSLLLFVVLPPEAAPVAWPEEGAGGDDGDPVAAEAVIFSALSVFSTLGMLLFSNRPARVEAARSEAAISKQCSINLSRDRSRQKMET